MAERVPARVLLDQLRQHHVSKWRIAKEINVSWQTVNLWDKGVFQPTPEHYEVLHQMAEDASS